MLQAPPPGFNPFSVNRQQTQLYQPPGPMGWTAQGYGAHPFVNPAPTGGGSAAVTPSAAIPSAQPQTNLANNAILQALQGGLAR